MKGYDLLKKADRLYFHGVVLSRYLETGAFMRLEWWLKRDLSYELAALAMIVLKDNRTATLCHGVVSWADTEARSEHAWVEFRSGFRWYVADFSSGMPGVFPKGKYFGERGAGHGVKSVWRYDYKAFWTLEITHDIWISMHLPGLSHVMRELSGFRPSRHSELGFEDWVCRTGSLFRGGEYMLPYYVDGEHYKVMSTEILQDFAKKRTRQQPRTKTVRRAIREIKRNRRT